MAEPAAPVVPPPPPGFTLDPVPPPPPGFRLDGDVGPSAPQTETKPFTPSGEKSTAMTLFDQALSGLRRIGEYSPLVPQLGASKVLGLADEQLKKAAYNAGGAATDLSVNMGADPETAALVGWGANVGTQAIPALLTSGLGQNTVRGEAERLMQSALKPSMKALKLGKGDKAVSTLLDEGITISRGGVEKLSGKVDDLNDLITAAIQRSGATVDKNAVASRIQDVVKRIETTQSTPQEAIKNVEKVYEQFMTNGLIPKNIPATQAQKLKQGIYAMLKDKYGTLQSETVEAQKALARGYKEELAAKIPEIAKLNAKESELLNALLLAEHRALQAGNKDVAGITWLASNKGAMAAFLADRSPMFKSIIARMVNAQKRPIAALPGAAVGSITGVPPSD